MNIETRTEGLMSEVQDLAVRVGAVKAECASNVTAGISGEGNGRSEILSNLSLAIRHLEDAQSRMERAWCLMGTATKCDYAIN